MRDENSPTTSVDESHPGPLPGASSGDLVGRVGARKVGVIGMGRMGAAMAANLVDAGFAVKAYVRRKGRIAELSPLGIDASTDMHDLLDCEFVITMVPDDQALFDIVFGSADHDGLAGRLRSDAVHLSMSTVSTAVVALAAAEHAKYGQGYVAAPVFGNPDAAAARELYIVAAGTPADLERCAPIFEALGQKTFMVGRDPAHANLIKLAGNMLTAASLEMMAEIMTLLRKRGVDPATFLGVLTQSMFDSRVHRIYGGKLAAELYARAGFVLPLALKDVRLTLAEAEAAAVPLPSICVVRDRLITGIAHGHAELDWTALGLVADEEAGIAPAVQPGGS